VDHSESHLHALLAKAAAGFDAPDERREALEKAESAAAIARIGMRTARSGSFRDGASGTRGGAPPGARASTRV